jgi:hypothetical protein
MGNCNSGRWYFWDAKTTVEDCLSIDTVALSRQGLTRPGSVTFGAWHWDSIRYSINMTAPHVRLHYRLQTGEHIDYCVHLVSTSPNYGGLRWWFICPAMVAGTACRRRVRKLYLPPWGSGFACRQCCQLTYTSQREGDMSRALSKAQAIRERLGGSASMSTLFPEKPKGMWRKTYRRLRASSEGMWLASLKAGLGRPRD